MKPPGLADPKALWCDRPSAQPRTTTGAPPEGPRNPKHLPGRMGLVVVSDKYQEAQSNQTSIFQKMYKNRTNPENPYSIHDPVRYHLHPSGASGTKTAVVLWSVGATVSPIKLRSISGIQGEAQGDVAGSSRNSLRSWFKISGRSWENLRIFTPEESDRKSTIFALKNMPYQAAGKVNCAQLGVAKAGAQKVPTRPPNWMLAAVLWKELRHTVEPSPSPGPERMKSGRTW